MRDECEITRNLKTKQGLFFTACEKRGLSISSIAAALDTPIETLRSYRPLPSREPSQMPLGMFIKLSKVVPANLMSILIEDSDHLLAPKDPRASDWLRLGERAATFASKVCRFQASGGHIDHQEDAELREDIILIASEGTGMAAGRGVG